MWDMRTGRALASVLHHTDQTRSLDFSQDGSSLLTASYDGLIGVCDCSDHVPPAASPGETSTGGAGGAGAPQVGKDCVCVCVCVCSFISIARASWLTSGKRSALCNDRISAISSEYGCPLRRAPQERFDWKSRDAG